MPGCYFFLATRCAILEGMLDEKLGD